VEQLFEVEKICRNNGIRIRENQIDLLRRYVGSLVEWNEKINLVSRKDMANIWFTHILHSISILFFVEIQNDANVLDLGSGGGLPGIPLAIVRDDLRLTLCDSIQKKTKAVEKILDNLGLTNAKVVCDRAENLALQKDYRGKFDVVVSRGVASLTDLIKWSKPMAHRTKALPSENRPKKFPPPFLLALKGGELEREIQTAMIKTGEKRIKTIDLVFDGSLEIGLEEKKIVIVEL
jgi:16S rRNA (guanine527-N7)-methyltransferase